MIEQEREFAEKAAQYQQELKHLQCLLQDKQESLDEVLQQKRSVTGSSTQSDLGSERAGAMQLQTAQAFAFHRRHRVQSRYFLQPRRGN